MVHRCLTHGILLAHPKKFARAPAQADRRKECAKFTACTSAVVWMPKKLSTYDQTTELVMFRVFSILVGARTPQAVIGSGPAR